MNNFSKFFENNRPIPITDFKKKKVTMSKRKRCLMKKAIELSIMCEVDIYMCIFDKDK